MGTEVKTCRLCQCFWEGVYATPAKERTSYRSWEEVIWHTMPACLLGYVYEQHALPVRERRGSTGRRWLGGVVVADKRGRGCTLARREQEGLSGWTDS